MSDSDSRQAGAENGFNPDTGGLSDFIASEILDFFSCPHAASGAPLEWEAKAIAIDSIEKWLAYRRGDRRKGRQWP